MKGFEPTIMETERTASPFTMRYTSCMKIKQISESELLITKNAWRKRGVGLVLASVLPFLPFVYKITKDYLPEEVENYSVGTTVAIGLIGVGMVIFSHDMHIRMQKGVSVTIGRRTLFGRTKKEVVNVSDIQAVQVVNDRSTDLAFIMKNGGTAVHFYSHQNQSFFGLGGNNDLTVESQKIADFLGVPLHSKGSIERTELISQAVGVTTEVLRPDTVKLAAENEDQWEQRALGESSAHRKLENREVRKELLSTVMPTVGNASDPQSQKPVISEETVDLVNRFIERPNDERK